MQWLWTMCCILNCPLIVPYDTQHLSANTSSPTDLLYHHLVHASRKAIPGRWPTFSYSPPVILDRDLTNFDHIRAALKKLQHLVAEQISRIYVFTPPSGAQHDLPERPSGAVDSES